MLKKIGISQELLVCRYLNGIKLLPREYFASDGTQDSLAKPIKSVEEVMQMPFSVFFLESDFTVKDLNEVSCVSHNIYSKSDAIGHTVAKVTNNKKEIIKLHENNKHVIETLQLSVVEENLSLLEGGNIQTVSFKMPWYAKDDNILGIFGCAVIVHQNTSDSIVDHFSTISNMFLFPHVS